MSRINPIAPEKAEAAVKPLFESISKKLGRIPNVFQTMGHSAAVLDGYLKLSESIDKTSLSPRLREQIALAVSEANQCQYCLSAHSAIANSLGIKIDEIVKSRKAESADVKTNAILSFSKKVAEKRGQISDEEVKQLKNAGVTDKEIVEIIFVITISLFTNYFNHIADPKIDFPEAPPVN
jgi:uncharacterized peroxidase-related enzyme